MIAPRYARVGTIIAAVIVTLGWFPFGYWLFAPIRRITGIIVYTRTRWALGIMVCGYLLVLILALLILRWLYLVLEGCGETREAEEIKSYVFFGSVIAAIGVIAACAV